MKLNQTEVAKNYLAAREALELAERAKAEAEALLREALAQIGTDTTVVDGKKIAIVRGERPNYDAETLRALVGPATFKQVTKPMVDGKKFKAAVELGTIKTGIAEKVTKMTPYEQIRVTELAADAEKTEGKTKKVA